MRPEAVAPPPPIDCCSAYVAAVLGCYVAFVSPFAFAVALKSWKLVQGRQNGGKTDRKMSQNEAKMDQKGATGKQKGTRKRKTASDFRPKKFLEHFWIPLVDFGRHFGPSEKRNLRKVL